MRKDKFVLRENLYLALGMLIEGEPPELFLIPSTVWKEESDVFVDRDYEGLKSRPEWGLNLLQKNMPLLEPYRFEKTIEALVQEMG